jgi:hypothetical protein
MVSLERMLNNNTLILGMLNMYEPVDNSERISKGICNSCMYYETPGGNGICMNDDYCVPTNSFQSKYEAKSRGSANDSRMTDICEECVYREFDHCTQADNCVPTNGATKFEHRGDVKPILNINRDNVDDFLDRIGNNVEDNVRTQVGGSHYQDMAIQPWAYFTANATHLEITGACKQNVLKYMRQKNDMLEDLKKASWYLEEWIKELENNVIE